MFFPLSVSYHLLEYITVISDLLRSFYFSCWLLSVTEGLFKSSLVVWWKRCCTSLWFPGLGPLQWSVDFTFLSFHASPGSETCFKFQRRERSRYVFLVVSRFRSFLCRCYFPWCR